MVRQFGCWIVWDQVYFGFDSSQQLCKPNRVLITVIDSVKHYILKSQPFPIGQRKLATRLEEILERILAVDWNQLVSQLIRSCRKRDGKVRSNTLFGQVGNLWNDA